MLLSLGVAACGGGQKKDAEEALARADRYYNAMRTEAVKVFPDPVKGLADSLQKAKDLAAAGDHKNAHSMAIDVANMTIRLAKAVPAKRTELDSTYKVISVEITHPVRQTVAKVREFNQSGGLPKGVSRAAFDSLKQDITTWEDDWKTATDFYQKGEIGQAAAKAMEVKANVIGAMKMLGLMK